MKNRLKAYGWILIVFAAVVLMGGLDQTTKDALKVEHILRTIERKPQPTGSDELSAEVTEKEVNAYIAYRLARKRREPSGKQPFGQPYGQQSDPGENQI